MPLTEDMLTCDRKGCGFHNPSNAERCSACGWSLHAAARAARKPVAATEAAPADSGGPLRTVSGVVTQGPRTTQMRSPQPFWFVVAAIAILGAPVAARFVFANTTLLLIIAATFGALLKSHQGKGVGMSTMLTAGSLSRRARRTARSGSHGLTALDEGVVFRLAEPGGRTWMVSFLPREQGRLAMGDEVEVTGHRTASGELRAWRVEVKRTGTVILSAAAVNSVICAAALVAIVAGLS